MRSPWSLDTDRATWVMLQFSGSLKPQNEEEEMEGNMEEWGRGDEEIKNGGSNRIM